MPRGLPVLIILLLILVGGAYYLSTQADEVPLQTMESEVANDAASL